MAKLKDPKKHEQNLARLRSLGTKIVVIVLILSGWLIFFSQGRPTAPPPGQPQQQGQNTSGPPGKEGGGAYVASYSIVLMSIGLGLLLVTRSSNRRDRNKPEQYQEGSGLVEEQPKEEEKKK